MTKKKGNVKYIVHFDLEDEELLDFPWYEDEDPPLIVNGRVRKKRKIRRKQIGGIKLSSWLRIEMRAMY